MLWMQLVVLRVKYEEMRNYTFLIVILIFIGCKQSPNYNPFDNQFDISVNDEESKNRSYWMRLLGAKSHSQFRVSFKFGGCYCCRHKAREIDAHPKSIPPDPNH